MEETRRRVNGQAGGDTAGGDTPLPTRRIRTVVLGPGEFHRIREAGGPLAELEGDLNEVLQSGRHQCLVPAVEVNGRIVAYWGVFWVAHAEPLWVAEAYRQPGVIRPLIDVLAGTLQALGVPTAVALIEEEDTLFSGRYAERLGFQPVEGRLYYVRVDPAAETVGVAAEEGEVEGEGPSSVLSQPPDLPTSSKE